METRFWRVFHFPEQDSELFPVNVITYNVYAQIPTCTCTVQMCCHTVLYITQVNMSMHVLVCSLCILYFSHVELLIYVQWNIQIIASVIATGLSIISYLKCNLYNVKIAFKISCNCLSTMKKMWYRLGKDITVQLESDSERYKNDTFQHLKHSAYMYVHFVLSASPTI